MRYLKLFKLKTEIPYEKICKKHNIKNWTLRPDGLVDVDDDIYIGHESYTRLPLQFGRVTGYFFCFDLGLTTLKGAPQAVGGDFACNNNKLTTLEGAPTEVDGHFYCNRNKLTTLKGAPTEVGGSFFCDDNRLTTLEGAPKKVDGGFFCFSNNLTTLKSAPEYVGSEVIFLPNKDLPIEFLNFLRLNDYKPEIQKYILKWQRDYAVWKKDGSFNKSNFIQMMEAAQDEIQNIKFS